MNKKLILAAALLAAAPAAFADGDAANGEKLFQNGPCTSCHGKDALGSADQYPMLAGQYKDYLIQALRQYKNGGRNNPIMKGMAANLTDQDIKDIAEYLSALRSPLKTIPKAGD